MTDERWEPRYTSDLRAEIEHLKAERKTDADKVAAFSTANQKFASENRKLKTRVAELEKEYTYTLKARDNWEADYYRLEASIKEAIDGLDEDTIKGHLTAYDILTRALTHNDQTKG